MATLYHNPRCSKSRQALALLQEKGIQPEIVLYLESPPDAGTLQQLLKKLGLSARDLLRKGEDEYKALQLDTPTLGEEALIAALCQYPKLMERPVFANGRRAVIGRPPERVLEIV